MHPNIFLIIALGCPLFGVIAQDDSPASAETHDVLLPRVTTDSTASGEGKCECSVFNTIILDENTVPILTQKPLNVSCGLAGAEICLKVCTSLAKASKERGPALLCSSLGHADNLKASIFYRTCSNEQWTYTGTTASKEVCCHENAEITCKHEAESKKRSAV